MLVKKQVVITGDRIKDAQPGFDQRSGGAVVVDASSTTRAGASCARPRART